VHKNALLTPAGREIIVGRVNAGQTQPQKPTARPSAASKLPCASGPMPSSTPQHLHDALSGWLYRENWHRPHYSL